MSSKQSAAPADYSGQSHAGTSRQAVAGVPQDPTQAPAPTAPAAPAGGSEWWQDPHRAQLWQGANPSDQLNNAANATAASSAAAVAAQTKSNRPTQENPFGFSQWSQDANGNWTQNNSLAPELQGAASGLEHQARANAQHGIGNGEDARNQAITGAYNQAASRLNPQWAQRDEQLSSALANQGLDPNSQAYRNAMLQESQQRNDAYGSAMNSAIGQGTAAQQATFNENLQAQQLPYQQLGAMYGLLQPFGFNAAGQGAAADHLGATSTQAQLDRQKYIADQAAQAEEISAGINAGGNVASAALGGGGGGGGNNPNRGNGPFIPGKGSI